MKALGVATMVGLFSEASGAAGAEKRQPEEGGGSTREPRFEVEIDGERVPGWREVQLPSNSTEEMDWRGRDDLDLQCESNLWGRTEYDDLTMIRGAKEAEMMLWEWRNDVIKNRPEGVLKDIKIKILDRNGEPAIVYEFYKAWPKEYNPPDLDASAVGGDSAFGQEELTIAYDRYRRTT